MEPYLSYIYAIYGDFPSGGLNDSEQGQRHCWFTSSCPANYAYLK